MGVNAVEHELLTSGTAAEAVTLEQRRRAARMVARCARDKDDRTELLAMLGLDAFSEPAKLPGDGHAGSTGHG